MNTFNFNNTQPINFAAMKDLKSDESAEKEPMNILQMQQTNIFVQNDNYFYQEDDQAEPIPKKSARQLQSAGGT